MEKIILTNAQKLKSLAVFSVASKDKVAVSLATLLDTSTYFKELKLSANELAFRTCQLYAEIFSALAKKGSLITIGEYLSSLLCSSTNPLSYGLMRSDEVDENINAVAEKELALFDALLKAPVTSCKNLTLSKMITPEFFADLPPISSGKMITYKDLVKSYSENGTGVFSKSIAFMWNEIDKKLESVESVNPITMGELKNYAEEKQELIENTENFIAGRPSLNALLYGERGTGKSSTISALLNKYHSQGLRIIEVTKDGINDLPTITKQLAGLKQKFIIFIDDLSFVSGEGGYARLKAVLEGSINKPKNILIYATSNRRHLISESHQERADDVHAGDTLQEQLSLADRFGLVVTFLSVEKDEYISILTQILSDHKIKIDKKELSLLAEKEATRKGGRSPRLARQVANRIIANATKLAK